MLSRPEMLNQVVIISPLKPQMFTFLTARTLHPVFYPPPQKYGLCCIELGSIDRPDTGTYRPLLPNTSSSQKKKTKKPR